MGEILWSEFIYLHGSVEKKGEKDVQHNDPVETNNYFNDVAYEKKIKYENDLFTNSITANADSACTFPNDLFIDEEKVKYNSHICFYYYFFIIFYYYYYYYYYYY